MFKLYQIKPNAWLLTAFKVNKIYFDSSNNSHIIKIQSPINGHHDDGAFKLIKTGTICMSEINSDGLSTINYRSPSDSKLQFKTQFLILLKEGLYSLNFYEKVNFLDLWKEL